MNQDTKQTTKTQKEMERDWVRKQIDARPVSCILDVTLNLELHKDDNRFKRGHTDDALQTALKWGMLDQLRDQFEWGAPPHFNGVNFWPCKTVCHPRFWISRDSHLDMNNVKLIVDTCNNQFKKWIELKNNSIWNFAKSAITFRVMQSIDFKI